MNDLSSFVRQSLSSEFPPQNPILRPGWAGLAFDRNVHEYLAPTSVWVALFQATRRLHPAVDCVGGISVEDLRTKSVPTFFVPTLSGVKEFFVTDARFLKDLFVFSLAEDWLVRLDQDVTLFAGERGFMLEVVNELGGLSVVKRMMISDLDPGPSDAAGLGHFIDEITAPLRNC